MDLNIISLNIRKKIIELANNSKSPHVGSSLSCVDILTVLYFDLLKLEPWDKRDIFVLSKAHSAMALYATIAEKGIISENILSGYLKDDGTLPAHLDKDICKGIEVSAGSLGHGFNIAIGIAHAFKKRNENRQVYALIGDGESQEGSIWEGAMFGSNLGLDNFTAILDYNNLQGYGRPREICSYEPVKEKWEAFGWYAEVIDGHNINQLKNSMRNICKGKPKIIIASTIKGKGVSFMENKLEWHYYIVTDEYKQKALEELS